MYGMIYLAFHYSFPMYKALLFGKLHLLSIELQLAYSPEIQGCSKGNLRTKFGNYFVAWAYVSSEYVSWAGDIMCGYELASCSTFSTMPPSDIANGDVDHIVEALTTDEAILLTAGVGFWHTHQVPRLGVPAIKVRFRRSRPRSSRLTYVI